MAVVSVLLFLCILLWNRLDKPSAFFEQKIRSNSQKEAPGFDARRDRSTKTIRSNHVAKTPLTPPDDPHIKKITDQLKVLEGKRTAFCRREENDSRILFEYLIKQPSPEEAKEINKLISQASGLTQDQNLQTLTWKQQLSYDYLPSAEFENFIVGIVYTKSNRRGDYSVQGVPFGKLIMRNGIAPFSEDGLAHLIYHNIGFKFDSSWRYSHLLNSEPEN